MLNPIRRTARWLGLLLTPGTGTHRAAGTRPLRPVPPAHPNPVRASLPAHRSPYGVHLPLDGAASRLVRPYVNFVVEVAA